MTPTNQTLDTSEAEKKHTPGPWIVSNIYPGSDIPTAGVLYVYSVTNLPRVNHNDVATIHSQGPYGEQQANAELIASAPDLKARADALEAALLDLIDIADGLMKEANACGAEFDRDEYLKEFRRLLGSEAHNGKKGGA